MIPSLEKGLRDFLARYTGLVSSIDGTPTDSAQVLGAPSDNVTWGWPARENKAGFVVLSQISEERNQEIPRRDAEIRASCYAPRREDAANAALSIERAFNRRRGEFTGLVPTSTARVKRLVVRVEEGDSFHEASRQFVKDVQISITYFANE